MITPATDLDAAIAAAERDTIVVWRGERIPFLELPDRIAATDGRNERNGMYTSWIDALEATNRLRRDRLTTLRGRTTKPDAPGGGGAGFALELERFALMSETVFYAALRRRLALIGIEQGDATLADAWYIERGSAWSSWFGPRDVERAATETGRAGSPETHLDGWRSGHAALSGGGSSDSGAGASAVRELYRWLVADPTWLAGPLRMGPDDIIGFADFAAYARLWDVREAIGMYLYGLRVAATPDESLQRAYYSGIVGNIVGVAMPDAAYLVALPSLCAAETELQHAILAGQMAERLESRFGPSWWSHADARATTAELSGVADVTDVLARLGYDEMDWRPLLRQIRTRLIGEMSGYGGPNITTRAGTRKV